MAAGGPLGKVDISITLPGATATTAISSSRRRPPAIINASIDNYASIDRGRFDDCRRLLYRCPSDYSDGLAIDYRCSGHDIGAALSAIQADGRRFDLMLVDPFTPMRSRPAISPPPSLCSSRAAPWWCTIARRPTRR